MPLVITLVIVIYAISHVISIITMTLIITIGKYTSITDIY